MKCNFTSRNRVAASVGLVMSWGLMLQQAFAPPNAAPVARNDSFTVNEDGVLSVAAPGVLANDSDADRDRLTAIRVTQPANGTLTFSADGSFSYQPRLNFNGNDSFTYKCNDGRQDSGIATVSITVVSVNDRPVATADSYTINEDEILAVGAPGVLFNDTDADRDRLSAGLVRAPRDGTVSLSANGSFVYTPNRNFNGSDFFVYSAADPAGAADATSVSLIIRSLNDVPTVRSRTLDVPANSSLDIQLSGADVDGDALTFSVVTSPTRGTITGGPISFRYTPNTDFVGTDSFTYRASDGRASSATATVTLRVRPTVTINDVSAREGSLPVLGFTSARFTIRLSPVLSSPVNVNFRTRDGSAQGSLDPRDYVVYANPNDLITFAAGETVKTLNALIYQDVLFEPDQDFFMVLQSADAMVLREGRCVILNDDIQIGVVAGEPADVVGQVGEPVQYGLRWTHPERWRLLDTIDIRLSDDTGEVITVRFSEPDNAFSLYDPLLDKYLHPAEPGSRTRFETEAATLYLEQTRVVGSGPTGPTVLLDLSLGFKPQAAGRVLQVEAFATDDSGNQQGFDPAGTITVLPRKP